MATLTHRLYVLWRIIWLLVGHIIHFPTLCCWHVVIWPLKHVSPAWYWWLESWFYNFIITGIGCWGYEVGHTVIESGDDIDRLLNSRAIVMTNHQSTADVPWLMYIMSTKHKALNSIVWIMDRILRYTHFGRFAVIHGDYFIQQFQKEGRDDELRMLADHFKSWYYWLDRRWVMVFPEGGFLYKRRARSQAYAKKNDLPVLENVSLPRVGALHVLLDSMNGENIPEHPYFKPTSENGDDLSVKYIIDITLGYPDQQVMDIGSFILRTQGVKQIHAHYRVFSVDAIPKDPESRTKWLYDRFVEKEYLLSELYKTGSYPAVPDTNQNDGTIITKGTSLNERKMVQTKKTFYTMHAFFMVSWYFFLVILCKIYTTFFQSV